MESRDQLVVDVIGWAPGGLQEPLSAMQIRRIAEQQHVVVSRPLGRRDEGESLPLERDN